MVFGENGLEEITIDSDILPEEARNAQNWHWDMGPLGMYKHYIVVCVNNRTCYNFA